mmetsp:Transcript_16592/g.51643  ORF Transcript_16592/g.51643 Transcript_16592/m.51643 type:complete len:230 (-) Transcript_16592:903-1592(-)
MRAARRRRDGRRVRGALLRAVHQDMLKADDGRRPLPALRLDVALRARLPRAVGRARLLRRRRRERGRNRARRGARTRRALGGLVGHGGARRRRYSYSAGRARRRRSPRGCRCEPRQHKSQNRLRTRPLQKNQGPARGRRKREKEPARPLRWLLRRHRHPRGARLTRGRRRSSDDEVYYERPVQARRQNARGVGTGTNCSRLGRRGESRRHRRRLRRRLRPRHDRRREAN